MRDQAKPVVSDLPLLASAQYLARGLPRISGFPHVVALISEFLDCRLLWDLPRACALGDVPLLRGIARLRELHSIEWTKDEPLFRAWQFSNASIVTAQHGDLDALQWLMTGYDTETPVARATEEAATFGHLHVLEWLHRNFSERTYWDGLALTNAVANNDLEMTQWLWGVHGTSPVGLATPSRRNTRWYGHASVAEHD